MFAGYFPHGRQSLSHAEGIAEKGGMAADERRSTLMEKRMAYPKFISVHRRLTIVIGELFSSL